MIIPNMENTMFWTTKHIYNIITSSIFMGHGFYAAKSEELPEGNSPPMLILC